MTLIEGPHGRKFGTAAGGVEGGGRMPRDRDSAAAARLVKVLTWGGIPGLLAGLPLGVHLAGRAAGPWKAPAFLAGLLSPPLAIVVLALGAAVTAGWATSHVLAGAASGGPRHRGYSQAEALAIRGEARTAATLYMLRVAEHPAEPEPYLRLARLHRDQLGDGEEAARWLRRAREEARCTPEQERLVGRELVALYRDRLGDPLRAAPELARLAERFPDTPAGRIAREELAELKRARARARGGEAAGA